METDGMKQTEKLNQSAREIEDRKKMTVLNHKNSEKWRLR